MVNRLKQIYGDQVPVNVLVKHMDGSWKELNDDVLDNTYDYASLAQLISV